MKIDIIQDRLKSYNIISKQSEENAFKEICQEIALAGLSRENFFKSALFQGGTCLRIIYGLQRFSEDLDFVLMNADSHFNWDPYLQSIKLEFEAFGLSLEVLDRSEADKTVKKAFLKENSFGKILNLHYPRSVSDKQKITIKLEIDTNPPSGSIPQTHYLVYPYPFPVVTQDTTSLFAGKCHALLCREYVKGRDWFDFIWYVQNEHKMNLDLLKNALEQCGPFQDDRIEMSKSWLINALRNKIYEINWIDAKNDVIKFLSPELIHSVNNWDKSVFLDVLSKLDKYL